MSLQPCKWSNIDPKWSKMPQKPPFSNNVKKKHTYNSQLIRYVYQTVYDLDMHNMPQTKIDSQTSCLSTATAHPSFFLPKFLTTKPIPSKILAHITTLISYIDQPSCRLLPPPKVLKTQQYPSLCTRLSLAQLQERPLVS